MLEQKPEEEQKQNCTQPFSQEISNFLKNPQKILTWMKIIFYCALFLSFLYSLFYFAFSIEITPEIENFQNFLFYSSIVFSVSLFIILILVFLGIFPGLLLRVSLMEKSILKVIIWVAALFLFLSYIWFLVYIFLLSHSKITTSDVSIFIMVLILSIIINYMIVKKEKFVNIILFLLILIFVLLIFIGSFTLKRALYLLKLGNYNATLIIDKSYADKINLLDFCNLSNLNNQSYQLNATILSSIGNEYIIKCKKLTNNQSNKFIITILSNIDNKYIIKCKKLNHINYKECIIKIPKDKASLIICKKDRN